MSARWRGTRRGAVFEGCVEQGPVIVQKVAAPLRMPHGLFDPRLHRRATRRPDPLRLERGTSLSEHIGLCRCWSLESQDKLVSLLSELERQKETTFLLRMAPLETVGLCIAYMNLYFRNFITES